MPIRNLERSVVLEILIFALILGGAAYLRFINLAENPAWYTDETTHILIAQALLEGETRYLAIQDSYLLVARLPLFEYLLAGTFRLFGTDIVVLRTLTASCTLLTILLLYLALRNLTKNRVLALCAMAAYAFYPPAVLYSRFGFSYNLLSPLLVLALWGLVKYWSTMRHGGLWIASLSIGLGAISEILMWSFLVVLAPLILFRHEKQGLNRKFLALLLAFAPLALYGLTNLLWNREAFLFDLSYSLARTGGGSFGSQFIRLGDNYQHLLGDFWWVLAFLGVFLLDNKTLKSILLIFLVPLVLIARTVPLYSLSAYYLIPFYPLLAIGLGAFLEHACVYMKKPQFVVSSIGFTLLSAAFALSIMPLFDQVHAGFSTSIDSFLIQADETQAVSAYLNKQTREDAIIISSAPILWLVEAQGVDFQMAVVANGQDAIHIPANLPLERFAYSVNYHDAEFVVIDPLWRNWGAVHIPELVRIMETVESEWELVYQTGSIQVYKNPELRDS